MNELDFYIEINARFAISENDEKNIYGVKNFSIFIIFFCNLLNCLKLRQAHKSIE